MEFSNQKAIYLQIADLICGQILSKRWPEDERIPSVREYAVMLEVNPNTVMKAYDELQQREIIVMRRGIGFFVAPSSLNLAHKFLIEDFIQTDLPIVFKRMKMIGFTTEELIEAYNKFIQQSNQETL
jgi:GntR family transcriptional regulator